MPAATPASFVNVLNAKANEVSKKPETKAALARAEIEAIGGSPQEFAEFMAVETVNYAALIKQAGIKPE